MRSISVSNIGKREINQDLILEYTAPDGSYLFSVIDGMGGYDSGEIAAKLISENIETYLSTATTINAFHIQKAINKSNLSIKQKKNGMTQGMGATIGGVVIKGDELTYFWIGDVKILHFRNKKLIFESSPHSLINDLVKNGSITEPSQLSKYKHVVTRAIQGDIRDSQAEMDTNSFKENADLLFVCSDGVHDLFDSLQIENQLGQAQTLMNFKIELESRLAQEAIDNYTFGIVYKD